MFCFLTIHFQLLWLWSVPNRVVCEWCIWKDVEETNMAYFRHYSIAWNDMQKLWKISVKLASFWDSDSSWYCVFWNDRSGVTSWAKCLVKEYMRRHRWFLSDTSNSYHEKGLEYCTVPSASWNWKRIYNQQRNLI